jgi:glycerol-3-phosphate dehydrogenase (NAD(P)+)
MITIIGRGVWGSALGSLLKENNYEFKFWDRKSKIDPGIIIIATPSKAIREVFSSNRNELSKSVIINTSKGIERKTNFLPFQIANEVLGGIKYFSLMGPSFAKDIQAKNSTSVCLAGEEDFEKYAKLFITNFFEVKFSDCTPALELGGAFKNIYAISCGLAEGLGLDKKVRANLIKIAKKEIEEICKALNFSIEKNALDAIFSDLEMTCSSIESRNYKFGKYLAKSSPEEALKNVNSTVEGYDNSFSVPYFKNISGLKLPLANFVYESVCGEEEIEKRFFKIIKLV